MEDPDFLWETGDTSEMDTTGESEDSYDMTAPHCAAKSFGPPPNQSLIGDEGKQTEEGRNVGEDLSPSTGSRSATTTPVGMPVGMQ
jgi:hypothetical protein